MVLTARDGEDVDRRLAVAALPEVRLEPLPRTDAAVLLGRVAPELGPALAERVLEHAAGNPLGVVELGEAVARAGGAALLPTWLPLSTRLERTFSGLVAELPAQTQELLLVAALDDGDDLDEMLDACRRVLPGEVGPDQIEPAVTSRLVQVDDRFRVRFRHPLLRSALYQAATAAQRRRVHAALAETVAADPERRVWHRAAAASGPDEALARELTETARRAGRRQAASIALAAFERAARLSEDRAARGRRLLAAVEAASEQGDAVTALRLLGEVEERDLTQTDRAWYGMMREVYLATGWTGGDRLSAFAEGVETMCRDGDTEMAVESVLAICLRVYWSNADPETAARLLAAAESLDGAADDPRLVAAVAQLAPVTRGAWCLERMLAIRAEDAANPREQYELGMGASALGACSLAASFYTAAAVGLRAQGRLGLLCKVLVSHAMNAAYLGDARTALTLVVEGEQLTRETRESNWAPTAWMVTGFARALRGDVDAARERADAAEAVLLPAGKHPLLALVRQLRGVAALAAGRPEEAFRELYRVFDPADNSYHPYTQFMLVGHLADAAVGCGALAELREVVAALTPVARECRSPALLLGVGYARAMLADEAAAFETALAADELVEWSFERARLQHAYGAWLRRQRRAADSRPLLRAAAATFDALGATAWADRSRAELRASGETLRRPVDLAQSLTPQEIQISRLAAEGLSNKEIAERLFLSPRTISTHLYRIYPKLGIKSRGELARVLAGAG
ncbi:LuxR family transcriptional regulator [Phytohabitans flavus]|uniref:LuxR family transcriptional regulator n=3 Tax=Phytohabitans flavus TaxID=1076124 RepID=A0A6F8XRZ6_9ACTN|nr:LuxR family transcriptional regulator [Phytohabitans flavus]BCB76559.1 LuxR family transcriptional regulator [Phytohabitans flavus]